MTVVILAEAEREFAESAAYYEAKEAELGWRFRTEVIEANYIHVRQQCPQAIAAPAEKLSSSGSGTSVLAGTLR